MPTKTYTADPVERAALCQSALEHLRVALTQVKAAGAERTAERVRLAITSCGGAIRHAQGLRDR